MQPQLCSRCKKNIAVVFITRQENGQNVNEGLCLKCAKNLGLPQVDEMMRRMGITDEDLDNISNEMMGAFGGAENLEGLTDADDPDADNEDEDGKTATFPFLSRFFRRKSRCERRTKWQRGRADAEPAQQQEGRKGEQAQIPRLLLHQSFPARTRRQARRGRRPRGGDRTRHPDFEPPPEEQPLPDR